MRINKKHAAVVLMIMFFAVSCGNKKEAAIEPLARRTIRIAPHKKDSLTQKKKPKAQGKKARTEKP